MEQTPENIAWAAGLWEGEGCWNIHRRSGRSSAQVQSRLAMSDRDVVERFAAIVGFGSVRFDVVHPGKPHWKPMHEWVTQRRDKTRELIQMFWPYLGDRRRAKAQEVLDLGIAVPRGDRTHCLKGHPYSGENLTTEAYRYRGRMRVARRCKICRQEQSRIRARKRLAIPPERWRITHKELPHG